MMLITHKWGKPISVKMQTQILFELSGSMFFLCEKNEGESQCPASKIIL